MTLNKKVSLKSFISREFFKTTVVPLILVEITLLGLYFLMNSYLLDRSISTLTSDRLTNLQEIVTSQRHIINGQLHSIINLANVLKSDLTRFFSHMDQYDAPEPAPRFGIAENGMYYKLEDNGGSCLFYSARTHIGEAEKEKALLSEALDHCFEDIYLSSMDITAVFLNTYDSMSRLYPHDENVFEGMPGDVDLRTTSLYYMGDEAHNPDQHAVLADAERDASGQGWTLSCLVPIYRGEFLEGVAGIKLSINDFVKNLLKLELPWGASTFLLDASGRALAMPEKVQKIFGFEEVLDSGGMGQADLDAPILNFFESAPLSLRDQLSELMGRNSGVVEISINKHKYVLYLDTVVESGWKFMVIADKAELLEPAIRLERLADRVGYIAIGFMGVFGFFLFYNLTANTRRMSGRLAKAIGGLSTAVRRLGTGVYEAPAGDNPVAELDVLSTSFNAMARDLKVMHENLEQEVRNANEAKNVATRAQAALKEYQSHLEKIVEKRTAELRESNRNLRDDMAKRKQVEQERQQLMARLQRAEKMEALGTLAGGVAHDLNNILSGIVGYPDLLLMEMGPDNPLRKQIETMQKSGQKAAAIVQNLLTLARRGVSVMEVTNLNSVLYEYLASPEHSSLLQHHPKIQIKTDFAKDLQNCMGSSVHLSKMIMNVVSNAAEAMTEGGDIRISTWNQMFDSSLESCEGIKTGQYVAVSITDSGHGIPEPDLEHIFEPFYTKKKMGRSGTGLGMAVVWGTVRDHQGYIDVKSTLGEGTRVEILFPATREKIASRREGGGIEQFSGNGEIILVVDDISLQGEIAVSMLTKLGYKAFYVESGEASVAWLKETPADLVILDMIMAPNIDGLETYRRILKIHPGQRAILVSGFSETDAVRKARGLGAGNYVKKPYTVEVLGKAVWDELHREIKVLARK